MINNKKKIINIMIFIKILNIIKYIHKNNIKMKNLIHNININI